MESSRRIEPDEVVSTADAAVSLLLRRLSDESLRLHEAGYHAYSASVANLRSRIEREYVTFVEEMMPS